jgi:hypothetical protein
MRLGLINKNEVSVGFCATKLELVSVLYSTCRTHMEFCSQNIFIIVPTSHRTGVFAPNFDFGDNTGLCSAGNFRVWNSPRAV